VSTVFNSYIGPTVGDYLKRLENRLIENGMTCSLLVMQTHGGLSTVEAVRNRPLLTVDSGPAGGVLGGRHFTDLINEQDIVCADVGGTTFDVGLIFRQRVQMDPLPVVDRYAYLTPKIYVKSIGAGGGSIAWVDAGGTLRVGPHSAGAFPGPACYGRGGTQPTVTDAHVVLGYLEHRGPRRGHRRNIRGPDGRSHAQGDSRAWSRSARLHRLRLWWRGTCLCTFHNAADRREDGIHPGGLGHVLRPRHANHGPCIHGRTHVGHVTAP